MNAFNWKGRPSKVLEELKKSERKQRSAQGKLTPAERLAPRAFHYYSKAGVK